MISKSEKISFKKLLKEKNKDIENLKEDIWRARFRENRKSKNKITTLSIFLFISLIVVIILSANLSGVFKQYSNYFSLYQNLKSSNKELEDKNRELSNSFKELEDEYVSLQNEYNEVTKNNNLIKEDEESGNSSMKEERTVPTVKLVIHEGPIYLKDNNICYYRIKAIVGGNPLPKIEFSKDDSSGTWGKNIAQINLYNNNDSYELTVKVSTSEGIATSSLILSWGCNE
ncbi:MAG: hypothetical protein HQ569_07615 [Actinobacteria bacterium]|nr:hypothetical protein [Actinomycetota bacterium]